MAEIQTVCQKLGVAMSARQIESILAYVICTIIIYELSNLVKAFYCYLINNEYIEN